MSDLSLKNFDEDIISLYENKIEGIESVLENTHLLLEVSEESFFETRQEIERIKAQLRDSLARNESLRKKDFDDMMRDILSIQHEREKETRDSLKAYFSEQKEIAYVLRKSLEKFRESITKNESIRIGEFHAFYKEILDNQEVRKKEVVSKLKEFQKEHQEMSIRLKELLAKGRELRIRELKSIFKEFKAQRDVWIARKKDRKEEVRSMLDEAKNERVKAAKSLPTGHKEESLKEVKKR